MVHTEVVQEGTHVDVVEEGLEAGDVCNRNKQGIDYRSLSTYTQVASAPAEDRVDAPLRDHTKPKVLEDTISDREGKQHAYSQGENGSLQTEGELVKKLISFTCMSSLLSVMVTICLP